MKQRKTRVKGDNTDTKSKITKILNPEENSQQKVPYQMANKTLKHIKRMDNNCHIPDLVKALSYGGLNLVL